MRIDSLNIYLSEGVYLPINLWEDLETVQSYLNNRKDISLKKIRRFEKYNLNGTINNREPMLLNIEDLYRMHVFDVGSTQHKLDNGKIRVTFDNIDMFRIEIFPKVFDELDRLHNTIIIDGIEKNLFNTLIEWSVLTDSKDNIILKIDNAAIYNKMQLQESYVIDIRCE